jgi:hypothetical protein
MEEVVRAGAAPIAAALLASCTTVGFDPAAMQDVYVADFRSDEIDRCRPTDIPLGHPQARAFFMRAKQVSQKTLHDHYNYAPCYIAGTLKHRSKPCDWEIRAGATGHIRCSSETWYFACDQCEDLFKAP